MSQIHINLRKQIAQVFRTEEAAKKGGSGLDHIGKIRCCGTQPSRISGIGHEECGKWVSILFMFQCRYCGFWFCPSCAEKHFGKTLNEHIAEMSGDHHEIEELLP